MDFFDGMVMAQHTPKVQRRDWMDDYEMEMVKESTLDRAIDEMISAGLYALDLETTGLDNRVDQGKTIKDIVGVCMAATPFKKGYYIPVRHKVGVEHNIPSRIVEDALRRLEASDAVAIFHGGKFDQQFLQWNGGDPIGLWDNPNKWEDTLIELYCINPRERDKRLKSLSKIYLGMEMIALTELFPANHKGGLDFSLVDPSDEGPVWYGCSDALCTGLLHLLFHPQVVNPDGKLSPAMDYQIGEGHGKGMLTIYKIEKMCVPATRWMERNRIRIDRKTLMELIRLGQREFFESLGDVFEGASKLLGRTITPNWYGHLKKSFTDDPDYPVMVQIDEAKSWARSRHPDPTGKITKNVPKIGKKREREDVQFLPVYDILSAQQLGLLMRELGVQGLKLTEKSGQVKTSKDVLDEVIDSSGKKFPFMGKVKRFRETQKALSSNLLPLFDALTSDKTWDDTIRIGFNAHKVDTGRFCTPQNKKPGWTGQVKWNFHSIPATYDPDRPECMRRIREVIIARIGRTLLAIDYSGVELRIATNLSREPKWLEEFFHCSDCDHRFPKVGEDNKPLRPPPFCPDCGGDHIGDLHTLTGINLYGAEALKAADGKQKRQNAKGSNFALCYGGGGNAVCRSTGVPKNEGWRIKNQFDKTYSGLRQWWKQQHALARKHGYVLTIFGRRYPQPDILHENGFFRSKAERNAVNGPVQGCLHPDCRIPTSEGLISVRDLYEQGESFTVWTGQCWSEARPMFSGEKLVRVTEFSPGTTIKTSPDHLFLTWRDPENDAPQSPTDVLRWIAQRDLVVGQWVAMSTELLEWEEPHYQWESEVRPQKGHQFSKGMTPHNYKGFSIEGNSEAMWEFLGLVYGDGSIHPERFIVYVGEPKINDYDGPSAEEIANLYAARVNETLGVGAYVYRSRRTGAEAHKADIWEVKVCNKAFRDFCLEILGVEDQNTYTKRFPSAVWRESAGHRAAFLRGYFGSDGHASASGDAASVRSINLPLLRDAHDLLRTLGIRSSYRARSLRVSVLDRVKFREVVGFTVPHKSDRLASMRMNPWLYQWDLAPPGLIRWVGETVYGSSIYAGLPRASKSAVLRLKAGSGSRHQCLQYLAKLQEREVPPVLLELIRYDWEQVVGWTDPGESVDMYDVEVFDEVHAFVADGCVIHNSSADIMKFAMALIYRACKDRGWLDLVWMTGTIHDELLFEIDDSIVEEAVELITAIMVDKATSRLGWPIPLAVDIEMGINWTVPYNLTEMTWDKAKPHKSWNAHWARLFPKRYAHYLSVGGLPVEGAETPPDTGGGKPPAEMPTTEPSIVQPANNVQSTPFVQASPTPKRLAKGETYTHQISRAQLRVGAIDRLAKVIRDTQGRGLHPLRVEVIETGEVVWDGDTLVDPTTFSILARQAGV